MSPATAEETDFSNAARLERLWKDVRAGLTVDVPLPPLADLCSPDRSVRALATMVALRLELPRKEEVSTYLEKAISCFKSELRHSNKDEYRVGEMIEGFKETLTRERVLKHDYALVLHVVGVCLKEFFNLLSNELQGKIVELVAAVVAAKPECAEATMSDVLSLEKLDWRLVVEITQASCSSRDPEKVLKIVASAVEKIVSRACCDEKTSFSKKNLSTFIDDLLCRYNDPSFPCVSSYLRCLTSALTRREEKDREIGYANFTADCVGKLLIKVKISRAEGLREAKGRKRGRRFVWGREATVSKKFLECGHVLKSSKEEILTCVGCGAKIHRSCAATSEREPFSCDGCSELAELAERLRFLHPSADQKEEIPLETLLKFVLIEHALLLLRLHHRSSSALSFYATFFRRGLGKVDVLRLDRLISEDTSKWPGFGAKNNKFFDSNPEIFSSVSRRLDMGSLSLERATSEGFCCAINVTNLQCALFRAMGSKAKTVRSRALKALAGVVEHDPHTMRLPEVQRTVSQRLLDESVSVREAALSLVGKYVARDSKTLAAYWSTLSQRFYDTGLSCKKRVARIFRDLLLANKLSEDQVRQVVRVFSSSAARSDDDFGDLLKQSLWSFWKSSDVERMAYGVVDQSMDWLRDLLRTELATPKAERVAKKAVERFVDECVRLVVSSRRRPRVDEQVVSQSPSKPEMLTSEEILAQAVHSQTQSSLSSSPAPPAQQQQQPDVAQSDVFVLVKIFAKVLPSAVEPHVETLAPLLKSSDSAREVALVIKEVFDPNTPDTKKFRRKHKALRKRLVKDLETILFRASAKDMDAAAQCLSAVSSDCEKRQSFRSFLLYLERNLKPSFSSCTSVQVDSAERALLGVGLFGRYFSLSKQTGARVVDALLKGCKVGDPNEAAFASAEDLAMGGQSAENESMRHHAVQAIGNVVVRHPQLILRDERVSSVVDSSLASPWDASIPLKTLYQLMIEQEKRDSSSSSSDENAPDFLRMIVTPRIALAAEAVTNKRFPASARSAALEMLRKAVSLDLTDSLRVVTACAFAAGDAEDAAVRFFALQGLADACGSDQQSREDFVASSLAKGIAKSCEENQDPGCDEKGFSYFGQAFGLISHNRRVETIANLLVRALDPTKNDGSAADAAFSLAKVVSTLPYSQSEAKAVVKAIDRILLLRDGVVADPSEAENRAKKMWGLLCARAFLFSTYKLGSTTGCGALETLPDFDAIWNRADPNNLREAVERVASEERERVGGETGKKHKNPRRRRSSSASSSGSRSSLASSSASSSSSRRRRRKKAKTEDWSPGVTVEDTSCYNKLRRSTRVRKAFSYSEEMDE